MDWGQGEVYPGVLISSESVILLIMTRSHLNT